MTAHRSESMKHSEETRISLLEQSIGHINETLIRMEKRFDNLESLSWSHFKWMLGTMIAISLTMTGILLKSHIG
jgi:hypothetical protein